CHTEFIVAAREGTKRCILRVLQNEGDVPGRVQVGDKLHVKAQRKVSEFLQLGRRQRIRFNDGRGALVLKVPLELDGESIDLEKWIRHQARRSEEHTSELQSRGHLVCRLLLEKKKKTLIYKLT